MAKTDIFGKKPYKNMRVKSAKPSLGFCFVIAVRTDADMLSFYKMIYTKTHYHFYISQNRFQIEESDKFAEFQSFIHKDIISDNKVFYLQNTSFESDKHILGYDKNALFQLKQEKRKRRNQLSVYFEEETDSLTELKQENYSNEIQNWYDFKDDLAKNSVDIMGKIDYLFPIRIETYEIIKPMLQHFPKMKEINYMLIEPEKIKDAISLFWSIDLMTQRINFADKKPSLSNG